MKTSVNLLIISLAFLAMTPNTSQVDVPDSFAAVLHARATRPQTASFGRTGMERSGNELFSFTGQDNAECVRAIPDINGDGKDEILVGFGSDQDNENLFCLDGASSGNATVLWKLEFSDGVSGGSCYGDQCLTPSSDVDQNGYGNFLAGTAWGGRTAYNMDGLDGSTIWKLDTYKEPNSGWIYSLCECGDVNGDGVPDAAFGVGSYLDSVFMVDGTSTGANPNVLWQFNSIDAVMSVRCIGDVDRDLKDDVLASEADNGYRVVCISGVDGSLVWQYPTVKGAYACGVLPDITGDGVNEALAVLWTGDGSAIRCMNGLNGGLIWSSSDVLSYGMAVDILEDVNGDQNNEVIVSSWENAVTVLSGADGTLVWKTVVGSLNGGDVWTARAIPDLNGDGREDVIAGSFDYYVYAMDGDSGEVFWKHYTGNRVFSVYPVGDLNGDGRPEVAAGVQQKNGYKMVYVLEGDANIPWPGLTLLGTGALGQTFGVEVTGDPGDTVVVMLSTGSGSVLVPPYGIFELAAPFFVLPQGQIPPIGPYLLSGLIPNDPGLVGLTLYFQALVATAPKDGSFTDMESVTFF